MKNLLTILSFLAICFTANAQQNLEFNQVINLKGNPPDAITAAGTVPTGKVWKVENYAALNCSWKMDVGGGLYVHIGGITVEPVGSGSEKYLHNVIWLKEGEVIYVDGGADQSQNRYWFSILEFNVVQ